MRPLVNRPAGETPLGVRIAGWAFLAYVFAVLGFTMSHQSRIFSDPAFAVRTVERPYATRIKGRVFFLGLRDYRIETLYPYAILVPLLAFAMMQLLRERHQRGR